MLLLKIFKKKNLFAENQLYNFRLPVLCYSLMWENADALNWNLDSTVTNMVLYKQLVTSYKEVS